jgi:adenylate cyclase
VPRRSVLGVAAWLAAASLPLVGLVSLLLREQLDLHWDNHRAHFAIFLAVGVGVFMLAYAAGDAANRRGDARVLLISLAFLATGGFLGLHAVGTAGVLFTHEYAGFKIANPIGLVLAAVFALASAFVDLRPSFGALVVRHRAWLRRAVFAAMALWFVWTISELPPLREASSEGGSHSLVAGLAGVGMVAYAVAAARYWYTYRGRIGLLQASVIACFVLLAEAMVGVALTGERAWHASWWEWHALIVTAYAVVSYAAHRQWHDERFRGLYLPTTRERVESVSVLFSDLVGYTTFAERATPAEAANVLNTYYAAAVPLLTRRFGGEVEKFMGDAMMATFNTRSCRTSRRRSIGPPARADGGRGRKSRLASAAHRRQQRRRGRARDGRRRVRHVHRRRGHRQHGVAARERGAGGRRADRRRDPPRTARRERRRGGAETLRQGQAEGGRGLSLACAA